MLNKDNEKKCSLLPEDFVDLENKIITCHSDSGKDNILSLEYSYGRIIKVLISKCKDSKKYYNNSVRIRTSGSNYEYYYQEFLEFFKNSSLLGQSLNKPIENILSPKEEKEELKKLSLLKRLAKNRK